MRRCTPRWPPCCGASSSRQTAGSPRRRSTSSASPPSVSPAAAGVPRSGSGHGLIMRSPPAWSSAPRNVARLAAAGVPVLAGTDTPNPGTVHGASLHRELELLVGDLVLVDGGPLPDITRSRRITRGATGWSALRQVGLRGQCCGGRAVRRAACPGREGDGGRPRVHAETLVSSPTRSDRAHSVRTRSLLSVLVSPGWGEGLGGRVAGMAVNDGRPGTVPTTARLTGTVGALVIAALSMGCTRTRRVTPHWLATSTRASSSSVKSDRCSANDTSAAPAMARVSCLPACHAVISSQASRAAVDGLTSSPSHGRVHRSITLCGTLGRWRLSRSKEGAR